MSVTFNDQTAWRLVGRLSWASEVQGPKNRGWGSVPTANQRMAADNEVYVYALADQPIDGRDFYMVTGNCHHGISGQPQKPSRNWVSVGFYGVHHALKLRCKTPQANLLESGPNSTVESATVGFSLGGSVSGEVGKDGGKLGAGFNAGVSFSYSASEVSFGMSPMRDEVSWYVRLPHVGWLSAGNPANPGNASYFGYAWEAGSIFSVPKGAVFDISSEFSAYLRFDWTRGIENHRWKPSHTLSGSYDPRSGKWTQTAAAATGSAVEPVDTPRIDTPLPAAKMSVMDALRSLCATPEHAGVTDSFLAALELTGIDKEFGTLGAYTLVFAPTNRAWHRLFQSWSRESFRIIGPASQQLLYQMLQAHFVDLPAEIGDQAREVALRAASAAGGHFRPVECTDGLLILLDEDTQDPIIDAVKAQVDMLLQKETIALA